MVFNSLEFFVFLGVVLLGYFLAIPARFDRARKAFLLVSSYVFYGSWSPPFVLLLLGSTLLDFTLGLRIEASASLARRRFFLFLSLLGNLGVLGFFKYGDFLREQFFAVSSLLGGAAGVPEPWNIILPVGISFYTFQTLSYSIDVYRGQQAATRSLLDFALFVSFFPQLVAGPIVRSRSFLPQLEGERRLQPGAVEYALVRVFAGLLKKVVLADTLGEYVDSVFEHPYSYGGPTMLLAIYAYAYQIYFDFSGYSDMAIGLAALFGFRIPENFNRPYVSTNPREFWQRWHISLSTWLRDYLYISLGGNRGTTLRTYFNLAVTMVLGGLWHGASWNFVVWGAFHGLWLGAHRLWSRGESVVSDSRARRFLKQIVTFHLVCLGWVFFRAPSLNEAGIILRRLFAWAPTVHSSVHVALVLVVLCSSLHFISDPIRIRTRFQELPPLLQGLGYAAIAVLVFLFSPASGRFIYFQF